MEPRPFPSQSAQNVQSDTDPAALADMGNFTGMSFYGAPPIQRQEEEPEETAPETIQAKCSECEAESPEPTVQRREEEEDGSDESVSLQRMAEEFSEDETPLQAKLSVGKPGDKYEQEADSMAARVMAMPEEREEEEGSLQAKTQIQGKEATPEVPANFESQLAQHKGSGQPLSDDTRAFMEPRFGADFSNVRVHETPDLTNAIQAQAFTHGQDIYFNSGRYNTGSSGGKELLAHELTHVVQQSNSVTRPNISMQRKQGKKLPKQLTHKIGKLDYYRERNRDYIRRHKIPPPPDYYLDYGDKYAIRFTKVLRPKLSKKGQFWIDKTFILLQQAMEDRLIKSRTAFDLLEQNADEFRNFAYGTHPDAYLDGGLDELPPTDLFEIFITPDLADILSISGVKQVIITGLGLLDRWIDADSKKAKRGGSFGGGGASGTW